MKIALLGDIAFFGQMSVNENRQIKEYFAEVSDFLGGFDYVVGNLETPFSAKKKKHGAKSAYICADVENVVILKQLHVNAVCLANNHMFDYGKEGYETTKDVLTKNSIDFFGAEGKDLCVEIEGNKIAFTGFCCFTSNPLRCVEYGQYGVNAYDVGTVRRLMSCYDKEGYFNIVAVHAGLEHVNYPSLEHIRAAHLLANVCPYVYYGHHPHVIQGVEEYKGSVIAPSLGNFCFDDIYTDNSSLPLVELTENNRTGMILELDIEENKLKGWREQVIFFPKEGRMSILNDYSALEDYNNSLTSCEDDNESYIAKRKQIIATRLLSRKESRDFMWYLKRLRLRYAQILLNARNNAKKYNSSVINYIK